MDFTALQCYNTFISESCRIHQNPNKSDSRQQESLLKPIGKRGSCVNKKIIAVRYMISFSRD